MGRIRQGGPHLGEDYIFTVGSGMSVQDRIYASATPRSVLDNPLGAPPKRKQKKKQRAQKLD